MISLLLKSRWNLLRLSIAAFIACVLALDSGARVARMALSRLPAFDYAAEIHALRLQGRYGEAEMLARAGLDDVDADHDNIRRELDDVVAERDSVLRRAMDVGKGALIGRGDSLESLIGALVTDFFVIGDVRDLVIEGGRYVIDGESDEFVVLLSVAGVVTTVAPEFDWVPAIFKSARKAGHVGEKLASELVSLIRKNRSTEIQSVFRDVRRMSEAASPGAAMRWIRHADSAEDLVTIADFVSRGRKAAAAMHITGESGAAFLKGAKALDPESIARAANVVEQAGRKGKAGAWFLQSDGAKLLVKPHLIVGLSKGVIKGNAAKAVERFAERIDPWGGTALAFALSWFVVECGLMWLRIAHWKRSES